MCGKPKHDLHQTFRRNTQTPGMSAPQRHILVLTYWPFHEGLIQAYTIPYLRIIRKVTGARITLVTLERNFTAVQQMDEGLEHFPMQVGFFSLKKMLRWAGIIGQLKSFCKKERVTDLHSWCTPGGAMAWLLSRRTGLPFVADSYEPHADAMVENGSWKKNSMRFRLLFRLEKKITHHAKELIAVSPYMKEYAEHRYGMRNRTMYVKPACTNLEKFTPSDLSLTPDGKVTGVYVGKLGGIYFEEEVFRFIRACADHWGERFHFRLIGHYDAEYIRRKCAEAGIPEHVLHCEAIPHARIPEILRSASFGITPVKPVPTKKCCTPIKDGEYWACGLPVVITRDISVDSDLISANNCGAVMQEMSQPEFVKAILKIDELLKSDQASLKERCRSLAVTYRNFIIAEEIYRKIYS
jgi:glycosyltransferase involved in cell wall biosynthesis